MKDYEIRWLLDDLKASKITERQWLSSSYKELIENSLVKKLNLVPQGGILRFPNSHIEDHQFSFRCRKLSKLHGGYIRLGEVFSGHGKTLEDAMRHAITVAVALVSYRGKRKVQNEKISQSWKNPAYANSAQTMRTGIEAKGCMGR